jgi:hypothetical protein
MLMGALLGYLFLWTGNIWVPVAAHFTNNAAAVLYYYFKGDGAQQALDLKNIGKSETYFAGIISMVLVAVLIYYFRRQTKRLPEE